MPSLRLAKMLNSLLEPQRSLQRAIEKRDMAEILDVADAYLKQWDPETEQQDVRPRAARMLADLLKRDEPDDEQTCPDGMPILPYDPDALTLPNPDTHMLPKDERSLRYSPDQPRRPNGEFGEGEGQAKSKTKAKPLSVNEAKAEFKKNAYDWQALPVKYSDEEAERMNDHFQQMKSDAEDAIKEGHPETNAIASLMQSQTIKEDALYRGMILSQKEADKMFKTGTELQMFPCSFSKASEVADDFSSHDAVIGKSEVAVRIELSRPGGRIHGIDIGKYDRRCQLFQEVISGGHIKVVGIVKVGKKMYVNAYQTGMF